MQMPPGPAPAVAPSAPLLNPDRLQDLVGRVALYPDKGDGEFFLERIAILFGQLPETPLAVLAFESHTDKL